MNPMNPMNPMNLKYREERVDKYFNPVPPPPSYLGPMAVLILGGVLCLAGIVMLVMTASASSSGSGGGIGCVGILALIAGVWVGVKGARPAYRRYSAFMAAKKLSEPRATDQEMSDWLEAGTDMAIDMGRRRLNRNAAEVTFTRGVDLLVFTGLPEYNDGFPVRLAVGDDGIVRASYYTILVVFLSHYRLSTYECVLEMRSGATVTDATKEYHLQDVDGLETGSNRVSFALPRSGRSTTDPADTNVVHVTSRQLLRLMVAGQPAISMVMGMSGDAQLRIDSDPDPRVPGPEDMIHTLREYLRSHKGGVLGHPTGMLPPQFPGSNGLSGTPGPGFLPQTPPHLDSPGSVPS